MALVHLVTCFFNGKATRTAQQRYWATKKRHSPATSRGRTALTCVYCISARLTHNAQSERSQNRKTGGIPVFLVLCNYFPFIPGLFGRDRYFPFICSVRTVRTFLCTAAPVAEGHFPPRPPITMNVKTGLFDARGVLIYYILLFIRKSRLRNNVVKKCSNRAHDFYWVWDSKLHAFKKSTKKFKSSECKLNFCKTLVCC